METLLPGDGRMVVFDVWEVKLSIKVPFNEVNGSPYENASEFWRHPEVVKSIFWLSQL